MTKCAEPPEAPRKSAAACNESLRSFLKFLFLFRDILTTITGSIGDPTDQIIVNGVSATVNVDGTWEAEGVLATNTGTASVDVQVADTFGNPVGSQNNSQDQPSTVAMQSACTIQFEFIIAGQSERGMGRREINGFLDNLS